MALRHGWIPQVTVDAALGFGAGDDDEARPMQRTGTMPLQGFHLGRLFGIRIALDWSVIVIFLLVAFNLGAGLFPSMHPDWSPALSWSVALAAAMLFLVSILLHELAHALVARAYGIPVRRITLFLFGGIADIEEEPGKPTQEALIAAVGPVVSIGLGVGFSVLGTLFAGIPTDLPEDPLLAFQHMGPLATLLTWLGPINVILGVFNLMPAFPLDGGRVLRAGLWSATRDLAKSTRWASRIGQSFAWLLIGTGILMAFGVWVPIFGTGLVSGLWLAFIGWFLNGAAAASYRQLVVKNLLDNVPVARLVLRKPLPPLRADAPVGELVDAIMRTGGRLFAVIDGERPSGIVRARDVRRVPREQWPSAPIRGIAVPIEQLPSIDANEGAYVAMQRMSQSQVDELAVLDGGSFSGIVQREDIARFIELQSDERGRGARRTRWAGT